MKKTAQMLHQFLFEKRPAYPLSLLRAAFGSYLLFFYFSNYWLLELYYGPKGIFTDPAFSVIQHYSKYTWNIFTGLDPEFFTIAFALTIVAVFLFTVGFFTRIAAIAVWMCLLSWIGPMNPGIHAPDLMLVSLSFTLMIATIAGHTQRTWSLDAFIKSRRANSAPLLPEITAWTTRLIQVELVMVYFFAAVHKFMGPDWYNGTAMHYVVNQRLWENIDLSWLAEFPAIAAFVTIGTLLFELFLFPILVWPKKTRLYTLAFGVIFHIGIAVTMRVSDFAQVLPLFYLSFMEHAQWAAIKQKMLAIVGKKRPVQPVIYFDGVCNLCNRAIQFVIKNDPKHYFRFAPLQSEAGAAVLTKLGRPVNVLDTMILVSGDKIYERSSAALRICRKLRFPWYYVSLLMIIPRFIRDHCYWFVSKNRYQWFGKQNTCMLPTPEVEKLFLK